jgi:hypothetical protein
MRSFLRIIALFLLCSVQDVNARKASKAATIAAVPEPRQLSSGEMAAAGAFATAFGVTIMHPVDTIKTLQQSGEGMGLNMIQATNKIMKVGAYYIYMYIIYYGYSFIFIYDTSMNKMKELHFLLQ